MATYSASLIDDINDVESFIAQIPSFSEVIEAEETFVGLLPSVSETLEAVETFSSNYYFAAFSDTLDVTEEFDTNHRIGLLEDVLEPIETIDTSTSILQNPSGTLDVIVPTETFLRTLVKVAPNSDSISDSESFIGYVIRLSGPSRSDRVWNDL